MKTTAGQFLLSIFIFTIGVTFFGINNVYAGVGVDCSAEKGLNGPHSGGAGGGNGGFTGNNCDSSPGTSGGSGLGVGQFSDFHSCVGDVECHIYSWYCAPPGCEEQYTETNCAKAPISCQQSFGPQTAVSKAFGRISPPMAIQNFGFGALGISSFLSALVILGYSIIAIIVLFMFFWSAFDWIVSGGEKEKVAAAQKRIVNASIGLVLMAASFAILKVLTTFTGFSFFKT